MSVVHIAIVVVFIMLVYYRSIIANFCQKWYKYFMASKTIKLAGVVAALSTAQGQLPQLQGILTPQRMTYIGIGLAVAIAYLRTLTDQHLDTKIGGKNADDQAN